jgi:hypothetical protein
MRIVHIFAPVLQAVQYDEHSEGEFARLMEIWTDTAHLKQFAEENNIKEWDVFVKEIIEDANNLDDLITELVEKNESLAQYFQPLREGDSQTMQLMPQKGKMRRSRLRIYALRITQDRYLITGGAIKMSQKMDGHPNTAEELKKIEKVRNYLISQDVLMMIL